MPADPTPGSRLHPQRGADPVPATGAEPSAPPIGPDDSRTPQAAPPTLTAAHRRALLGRFRRWGLSHHDAEDCAQATLLRVHAALHRYERRAPFAAFVQAVSRSVYADWCRRQRVRRAVLARGGDDDLPQVPGADALEPGWALDVRDAVSRLPAKLADVVELGVRQGLCYREVSQRLGIPVGTVKSRMFLAVQQLRQELGRGS